MGLCRYISWFSSLDDLGITCTNGQSTVILFADRINKSLKRPISFFILKVDQSPVRGRPESRNAGFGRPDSFMPTHRATGPGNSGDVYFSLCKVRVYARHYGDIYMVKALWTALLKSRHVNVKLFRAVWAWFQKPRSSTALRGRYWAQPPLSPTPRPHRGRGYKWLVSLGYSHFKNTLAVSVAERLRPIIFSALTRSSSHRCGFKPSSGHMWRRFCLRVARLYFSEISHFRPT